MLVDELQQYDSLFMSILIVEKSFIYLFIYFLFSCISVIAPYLLKLGLPLPALIACITSALPVVTNDTSAIINQITDLSSIQPDAEPSAWMSRAGSWRCASLESVLIAQAAPAKAAGKKALPPVVSRANPTTSLIERVHTGTSTLKFK
jgi:hypothetical protein